MPGVATARPTHNGGALPPFSTLRIVVVILLALCFSSGVARPADSKSTRSTSKEPAIKNVSVDEFDKLRTNSTSVILDVRTPNEYALGHIPGAVNIDWYGKDFTEKVAALDKSHTYLVHCASGNRSAKACQKMSQLNFIALYNLEGGFKAWEQADKPVEKARKEKSAEN